MTLQMLKKLHRHKLVWIKVNYPQAVKKYGGIYRVQRLCWESRKSSKVEEEKKKLIPVRLLCIMQVLGQNANRTHDCLAHIKPSRSLDEALDHDVGFPAERLMQRLGLERLRNAVPRQDELGVGALKDWGERSQRGHWRQWRARSATSNSKQKPAATLKFAGWNTAASTPIQVTYFKYL